MSYKVGDILIGSGSIWKAKVLKILEDGSMELLPIEHSSTWLPERQRFNIGTIDKYFKVDHSEKIRGILDKL